MERGSRREMEPFGVCSWHALPLFVASRPEDKNKSACAVQLWDTSDARGCFLRQAAICWAAQA